MKYNRPCFVKGPTECIYDDPALYNSRGRKRRIAEGKIAPSTLRNSAADKERLRQMLKDAGS